MKTILIAAAVALLGASAQAQTLSKPAPNAAGLGKPDLASTADAHIRAYIELRRTDLKKSKSQVIGDVMRIDADEAAKFWPVYKDFEAEFAGLGDKVVALIKNYTDNYVDMTGPAADQIANQILSIELQRNELKKKYYERFKTAVGPIVAARFLQVENQIERLVDLQIAAELPVISK